MSAMWLSVLLAVAQARPASVAMVLNVKGEVTLTRGQAEPARIWSMALLEPGDRLALPLAAEAVVFVFQTGHTEILAPGEDGNDRYRRLHPRDAAVVRKEPSKLGKRALTDLRDDLKSGRLGGVLLRSRNDAQAVPLITPLPGGNILTGKPTFTWPEEKEAAHYVVEVFTGPDTKDLARVWRVETKTNCLPFPEKQVALKAELHRWNVVARLKNGDDREVVRMKQATFTVATEREKKLLATVEPLTRSDNPADLLLAAGLYETRAVFDEAFRLYERLVKILPNDARMHEVLADYYEAGGRPGKAKEARDRARELRRAAGEK